MPDMVHDLHEERLGVIAGMQSFLDGIEKEKRNFTAEEQTKYDAMNADVDSLKARMDRVQEQNQRTREAEDLKLEKRRKEHGEPKPDNPKERVARAFEGYLRHGDDRDLRAELRASTDPQNITTDADGAYTVPDEWYNQLVRSREAANIMRPLATVIQSSTGQMNIPKEDTTGVASWTAESGAITVDKEDYTTANMVAHKMARIIKITSELLNDSMFNFVALLTERIGRSMGVLEEAAFIVGDNSSKPNGIFTAATTGVTAAGATTITADEIIDLKHSVTAEYRGDAKFMMADATLKLIRQLKDGNSQYLWQPGLQADVPDRLLGNPVVTSENCPAATTGLDSILYGWIGGYWIADRVGMSIVRLDEIYAVNDQVGFRGTARTDGELIDTSAVRVLTMG